MTPPTYRKRSLFPHALKDQVRQLLPTACKGRGTPMPLLLQYWPDIIGQAYARHAIPLQFIKDSHTGTGILTIKASGPIALELSHREPQILEKITVFLGYRAVNRLKIVQ